MPVVEHNKECCGCRACVEICPKKAIQMKEDRETFLYPAVDTKLCVECGLCEKVCPIHFDDFNKSPDLKAYVGISDTDTRYRSSSGGAFTAIYHACISEGYIVYGVAFDDNRKAVHTAAVTEKECEKFRKSKYVMSDTNGCFQEIADYLKEDRRVLFSGTPCQCAALRGFLKARSVKTELLLIVNVLCHGAPSQGLFDSYMKEVGGVGYQFRYKERNTKGPINGRSALLKKADQSVNVRNTDNDPYLRGFYKRLFCRPSCYTCKFARQERMSDITLGDAWEVEKLFPDMDTMKGVSLLLFNTEKGKKLISAVSESMDLKEVSSEWALNSQEIFHKPSKAHAGREQFFKEWPELGFTKAVFRNTKPSKGKIIKTLREQGLGHVLKKIKDRVIKKKRRK